MLKNGINMNEKVYGNVMKILNNARNVKLQTIFFNIL